MNDIIFCHARHFIVAGSAAALLGASCSGPPATLPSSDIVSYDVGVRPREVAIADLDGDGRLDVVVANSGDSSLTLLLGIGDGRLRRSAAPVSAGLEPADVDAADIDKDGDVDLIVANHETSRITVLLNDGKARFAPAAGSPVETGARPHVHGLAMGDFDGDGWVDVAVESADTKEVRVLRGGAGGFGAVTAISAGTMPYSRLGSADVSGDGRADVLVPGHGDNTVRAIQRQGASLALSAWTIRTTAKPWMVVGDDVNGDKRTDIVVAETDAVSIWLSGRDGFVAAPGSPYNIVGATEVATGDIDGDGVTEVVVGPWDGDEITVFTGKTLAMRKLRACERPVGLAIADLDGDRRGEIVATCSTQNRIVVVTSP
ncbi:MAG: VCBS repeat-containing protein [Gemmatimonadaceae bacterium]|nr:VCBS repeat-containing protein [Gemmatimonadaceae bacterium]